MPRRAKDAPRDTRTAIIEAAMRGFGERGFAATGIREIAALAGTNVASISYHFGGKEGLRAACAEHIVEVLGEVLAAARTGNSPPEDPEAAERALAALVHAFVRFLLLEPQARLVAGFILREMAEPSAALDIIYGGLFEGLHRRLCAIWGVATGAAPESERCASPSSPRSARSSTSTLAARWCSGAWTGRRSAPPRPAPSPRPSSAISRARLAADRRDAP